MQPCNVYREQLSSLFHGCALWEPEPVEGLYDKVSIGDVGYVSNGFFYRMFNVTLQCDDPLNTKLGQPDYYKPLEWGQFANVHKASLEKGDYNTPNVSSQSNVENYQARDPRDAEGVTYTCNGSGALLSLPHDAYREDVIRTKVFEDYIRDNVVSWFEWSRKIRLGIDRMEDLILVTGCTLVTSWAAVAFLGRSGTAEISLAHTPHEGERCFTFSNNRGDMARHCSRNVPTNPSPSQNQCVFVRGFRAKRRFFRTIPVRAAAEPLPDDPDNRREDDIQVTQVPDAPKDRDSLIGVLDYIVQNCPEDTIAIAHDDDLQLIENVETLTADAVERFLHQNQVPVLVENGAAILRDLRGDVPEEKRATFFATADLGGEPVPLIVHPVLTKYLLDLDIGESVDPDYDLPTEELTSPAVHPPVSSLKLENRQGYPAFISIQASGDAPNIGVTVQDVLRMIHEDLRKPSPRPAWDKLNDDERAEINASFKERCRTEEELSGGLYRFDYLRGRHRLIIFPALSPDSDVV